MLLTDVRLSGFRSFAEASVELSDGINILCGANAEGKTSFLEAVYFCATGRSMRTRNDRELVRFGENEAHIRVLVENDGLRGRVDAHLRRNGGKGIAVNGIPIKKLGELFGAVCAVSFSPDDLSLVKDGPAERRRFLDIEISRMSGVYFYELQQYFRLLRQRNELLKSVRGNRRLIDTISSWDEQMTASAFKIIRKRREFIGRLSAAAALIHQSVTSGAETLEILYKPSLEEEGYLRLLHKSLERDILLGSTSAGVHKDDAVFLVNGRDARVFGSQGQQRTAALAAKLAIVEILREEQGGAPILLLDDVLSELDQARQEFLMSRIGGIQTIITATGAEGIFPRLREYGPKVYRVAEGRVTRE